MLFWHQPNGIIVARSGRPRRNAPPLKHVQYARVMSVCIAAVCQDQDEPRIALCVDTRIDRGYQGVADNALKLRPLGHGMMGMLASDDFTAGQELLLQVRAMLLASDAHSTKTGLKAVVEAGILEFVASPFYTKRHCHELIIAGFVDGDPLILYVNMENGKWTVALESEFKAAGSGMHVANIFLTQRQCGSQKQVGETLYSIFEAKRHSEVVSGVGPGTLLAFIAPHPLPNPSALEICVGVIGEAGLAFFESLRSRLSLQAVPKIPELPDDFYA